MAELPLHLQGDLEGRYRIERELGRGGMATVYLARDLRHGRPVALKVIRSELVTLADRFVSEIRLTAGLQHPHILPLLDSGTVDGGPLGATPWYVMPYVEGESLRRRLEREHQLPLDHALAIARGVAAALACAHAHGIIHRDIKPENILLSGGEAVVADFGLARAVFASDRDRLTSTGLVLGTPAYMSPEQAAADPAVGPAADIYALGAVLYEMLAGTPPFPGPSNAAMLARRLTGPPPSVRSVRPAVPVAVDEAITRALASAPADRFPSADAFARALDAVGSSAPVPAPARRRRPALLAAGVAVLLLLAGTWLVARPRAPPFISSASRLAVLPFEPSGPDTALARLGRDLVFTLSAALDGLGGIQVVDAHSVLAAAQTGGLRSVEEATALGRRFGAGSVVHGSLVRFGSSVRLDFVVLPSGGAEPAARGSVTGSMDSIAALTDWATRELLRGIWARGSPPTPSLDGALKTSSVEALRAFLQGEAALARGRWDSARAAYEQAMVADPAFPLAKARYVYATYWTVSEAPESVITALAARRSELPERERMTTELIGLIVRNQIDSVLDQGRLLTERYPGSWFGWLLSGDQLLHFGPLLGHTQAESRAAFERALDLNPSLIPAWEHLLLLALLEHDTAASGAALRALTRLDAWPGLTDDGYGNRSLQFRYLDAIVQGDSVTRRDLVDSLAHDPAPGAVVDGSFYDPFRFGFFEDQIRVSELALRSSIPPATRDVQRRLWVYATAGRGAWDSALVAMDRLAREDALHRERLGSYGMAVVGAWIGAVEAREAEARRGAAVAAAGDDPSRLGELAWLDGIAAAHARDRNALASARDALRRSGDPHADVLDRALGAFDADLRAATREAGSTLAKLEWEEAARLAPDFDAHPWAIAVHRLAAARWLANTGDFEQAARLLRWVDAPQMLHEGTVYGIMLSGPTYLDRARLANWMGKKAEAAEDYREFLRRVDRPTPRYRTRVDEAREALRGL
jgi:tetratricopeptide (TPR) repeat protein